MITSADGTTIGCRSTGTGPGLLVVHGVLDTSHVYQDLADELASDFTVHVVDRRGRGEHGLLAEVEDVWAVLEATGAGRVFGVGSGAVIALEAALRLSGITHVAAYEPPISPERERRLRMMPRRPPTVRHDFRLAKEGSRYLERFRALRSRVLLLGGAKSARHHRNALHALGDLLPQAEKVLVEQAGHDSPAERPRLLVPALKRFF